MLNMMEQLLDLDNHTIIFIFKFYLHNLIFYELNIATHSLIKVYWY